MRPRLLRSRLSRRTNWILWMGALTGLLLWGGFTAGGDGPAEAGPLPPERAGAALSDPPLDPGAFYGTWQIIGDRSTSVDPWRRLRLEIRGQSGRVTLKRIWSGNREAGTYVDSVSVPTDGTPVTVAMGQWPDNRHLGAFLGPDSTKQVTAQWMDDGRTLRTQTRLRVRTSQGTRPIRIYSEYRIAPDSTHLTLLELRSTRPSPLRYVFSRER